MARSALGLPPLDELQRYSIHEAASYLRISRAHIYHLIQRGDLRSIRDGARRFVPGTEIARHSRLPEKAA